MKRDLEDARNALKRAHEELNRYHADRDPLRLRNACEKGWLSVMMATDILLMERGYTKPGSYSGRRSMLEELESRDPNVAEAGIRDKFGARGFYLHIQGYHEGMLSEVEVERELKKVEEYLRAIKEILG